MHSHRKSTKWQWVKPIGLRPRVVETGVVMFCRDFPIKKKRHGFSRDFFEIIVGFLGSMLVSVFAGLSKQIWRTRSVVGEGLWEFRLAPCFPGAIAVLLDT